MAKNVSDQVCLNHTDRAAVTRCETCFKPLCGECVIRADDMEFCSGTCAANHAATTARLQDLDERTRLARRRQRLRRLVRLAVLLALGIAAVLWCRTYPEQAQRLAQAVRRLLGAAKGEVDGMMK